MSCDFHASAKFSLLVELLKDDEVSAVVFLPGLEASGDKTIAVTVPLPRLEQVSRLQIIVFSDEGVARSFTVSIGHV